MSISPVRIRQTDSTGSTKILPSPMLPVLTLLMIVSITLFTEAASTTISTLILGMNSTLVFRPPVDLGMALLPAEALDLTDGHAVSADRGQILLQLIELEGLDNCHHLFHRHISLLSVGLPGCMLVFLHINVRANGENI